MKTVYLFAIPTLAFAAACSGQPGDAGENPARAASALSGSQDAQNELQEAQSELSIIQSTGTSRYQHPTSVDTSSGQFFYDCSGFLNYATQTVNPTAFSEIYGTLSYYSTSHRLQAVDYQAFFTQLPASTAPHWTSYTAINSVDDVQPGDIIAWCEDYSCSTGSGNTGHVMMVTDGPVTQLDDSDFAIPVVDSTESPHGTGDSRPSNSNNLPCNLPNSPDSCPPTNHSGLGTGTIVLIVDPTQGNQLSGHYWSVDSWRKQTNAVWSATAIGRLL